MDSTGFFLAAFQTGRKVAISAVKMATPISTAIDAIPKTKIAAPIIDVISAFNTPQRTKLPIKLNTIQMSVIVSDSEKKILNTSKLLAPTARKMPISRFLCEMDTEMKLERSSAANTAITRPT